MAQPAPKLRIAESPEASREEELGAAARSILRLLSPEERARILSEFASPPSATPKAGQVLGAIVRMLPRRMNWTVDEVKAGVDEAGVEATPKEIYNALGYLTRRGQVTRIAYGKYQVAGAGLDLPDDIAGPQIHRATEHDA